jgi:hypothetical protein
MESSTQLGEVVYAYNFLGEGQDRSHRDRLHLQKVSAIIRWQFAKS